MSEALQAALLPLSLAWNPCEAPHWKPSLETWESGLWLLLCCCSDCKVAVASSPLLASLHSITLAACVPSLDELRETTVRAEREWQQSSHGPAGD